MEDFLDFDLRIGFPVKFWPRGLIPSSLARHGTELLPFLLKDSHSFLSERPLCRRIRIHFCKRGSFAKGFSLISVREAGLPKDSHSFLSREAVLLKDSHSFLQTRPFCRRITIHFCKRGRFA